MQSKEKPQQATLPIKYRGIPLFQRIGNYFHQKSLILDHIRYWRSPLLCLNIFLNTLLSATTTFYLLDNLDKLPTNLPIFWGHIDFEQRFIAKEVIILMIGVHTALQAILIVVAGKTFPRLKHLSGYALGTAVLLTMLFYAGICKSLRMSLP